MKKLIKLLLGEWGNWQDFAIYVNSSNTKYLVQVREHSRGAKQFKCRHIHGYAISIRDVREDLLNLTAKMKATD